MHLILENRLVDLFLLKPLSFVLCADVFTSIFNSWVIDKAVFPDELKVADIISVYKKNSTTNKAKLFCYL